jgi:hypothetical protein
MKMKDIGWTDTSMGKPMPTMAHLFCSMRTNFSLSFDASPNLIMHSPSLSANQRSRTREHLIEELKQATLSLSPALLWTWSVNISWVVTRCCVVFCVVRCLISRSRISFVVIQLIGIFLQVKCVWLIENEVLTLLDFKNIKHETS